MYVCYMQIKFSSVQFKALCQGPRASKVPRAAAADCCKRRNHDMSHSGIDDYHDSPPGLSRRRSGPRIMHFYAYDKKTTAQDLNT